MIGILSRYAHPQSGRLLAVGADQQQLAKVREAGFTITALSAGQFESNPSQLEPGSFHACILNGRLTNLRAMKTLLVPGGSILIPSPALSVDQMQIVLLKAGFGDLLSIPDAVVARSKDIPPIPYLSVIVPVYNEAATCAELLDSLLAKSIPGLEFEVIIVESNSTDGSRDIVKNYADHPRVRLVLEETPRGKGHAVRQGFQVATGTIFLIQDADLEYDLDDYEALLEPILKYETNFVLGSRHNSSGAKWKIRKFTEDPFLASFFNLGHLLFLTLFNVLYGQKLTDPFTMFKVFRRECLYGLTFECDRFDFDHELVIKLIRKGYKPLELPVNYTSRSLKEGKKVTVIRDPLTWIVALLKFRRSRLYDGI